MNSLSEINSDHSGALPDFGTREYALQLQHKLIKDFFSKDSSCEVIESLHALVESFLFSADLAQVTPEMREHIVNQLRVATLIAKLDRTCA